MRRVDVINTTTKRVVEPAAVKKGKAKDYIGKTLTVTARQAGDDHKVDVQSGQTNNPQAKFFNDMKLISADGSAALLKP